MTCSRRCARGPSWPAAGETNRVRRGYARITLGNALLGLGKASGGSERAALLKEAEAEQRSALEVLNREEEPGGWAQAKNGLGEALLEQGSPEALEEALAAFRDAVTARSYDWFPRHVLAAHRNQIAALEALGRKQEAEAVKAEIAALS
jgi:hypothetical protein